MSKVAVILLLLTILWIRIPSATSILPDALTLANLHAKTAHDITGQKSEDGGHRCRLAGQRDEPVGVCPAS